MPDGPDGCKRYKMTKKDGSIFYAKTYDRSSIDGQTLESDSGWEQIGDAGGKHCYQYGKPFTSDPVEYIKTELKVDEAGNCTPTGDSSVENISLKFLVLAGFSLILKALAPTCSVDQCCQSVLKLAIKLRNK